MIGDGPSQERARLRVLATAAALAAAVVVWSCSDSDRGLPTQPAEKTRSGAEVESNPARMPIVLVHRHSAGTATATPTPTPSGRATLRPTSTRTHTPSTPSATPTPTLTPTPTPVVIKLRADSWQWNWVQGPPGSISQTMGYPGLNTITLQKGVAYELHIYSDAYDQGLAPHTFSGIPSPLSISGGQVLYQHQNELVRRFTPSTPGSFFFNCGDTACSDPSNIANEHDLMHGWINVQ